LVSPKRTGENYGNDNRTGRIIRDRTGTEESRTGLSPIAGDKQDQASLGGKQRSGLLDKDPNS